MIPYSEFKSVCENTLVDMQADTPQALLAISMIVAHESRGGTYWEQIGGPALGIIQMEPWVHDDVWKHCDSIQHRANLAEIEQDVNQLRESIRYNVFMARCRLIMIPEAFPNTPGLMARYLKKYWNSDAGKATPAKYLNDYNWWVGA